jgi:hypothetical protein
MSAVVLREYQQRLVETAAGPLPADKRVIFLARVAGHLAEPRQSPSDAEGESNMSRKERRAAASRQRKFSVRIGEIYERFDITVEGKEQDAYGVDLPTPWVMILANAKGRKITEDLWPDVEWARDVHFADVPEDWQFTHVCVTQLPQHLAEASSIEDASGDGLAFVVATALQAFAEPRRVAHMTGRAAGGDFKINIYTSGEHSRSSAREIMVEYVPATPTAEGAA